MDSAESLSALCWQAWQFYLVLPSFILNLLRHTALTTALTQEADKCGFGQGELRGMIGNLGCDTDSPTFSK